jgi:hypothetical protein
MSEILEQVLTANKNYAETFGDKGKLALPPAREFAILTCMDARIDPAKLAGLSEGDAHVIRNAGGRASDDAIRSLVISHKLLGTKEWFVIHHTNCGMELFSDAVIRELLASSLETASYDGKRWSDKGAGPARATASSSTGSPSRTRPRASQPTSSASAPIRSSPRASPCTATSIRWKRDGSSRSPRLDAAAATDCFSRERPERRRRTRRASPGRTVRSAPNPRRRSRGAPRAPS